MPSPFSGGAQEIEYAVTAGLSVSHPKSYQPHCGLHAGMKGTFYFKSEQSSWFTELNLLLANRGWKDDDTYNMEERTEWTCSANYLDIPIYLGYSFRSDTGNSFGIAAGPYLSAGLWGKSNIKGTDFDVKVFKDGCYKRFDCGITGKLFFRRNQFGIDLSYSAGLIKPTTDKWKLINPKDRRITLACSYYF